MKIYQVFKEWFWNNKGIELSEIKTFQTLINCSYKLKALLIYGGKIYPDLIGDLYKIMNNFCLKERRSGKLNVLDVVNILSP